MKKTSIALLMLLSSTAFAKVNVSGVITPTIKSGAASASDAHTLDIEMADAQLNFEAEIKKDLTATLVIYADQEALEDSSAYSLVDEAYIVQKIGDASIKVGRSYINFGSQETNFISDPTTLEFGEVQTEVVEANYEKMGFTGAIFTYEASAWEDGKEGLNSYGASLGYENDYFALGASYISNMSNSEFLEDLSGKVESMPAAYAVYGKANYKGLAIMAEYMSAVDSFNNAEFTYSKNGVDQEVTPSTLNLEIAYTHPVMGKDVTVATGYQMNSEIGTEATSGDKVLAPTQVLLAGASVDIYEGANLAVEYRQATDEKSNKGGATDGHTAHMTTLAYSLEF